MSKANIPDPYCPTCDGVGWYEGGATIKTDCHCLKLVSSEDADRYVTNGTFGDWLSLYQNRKFGL